ncbi:MAG: regulatory protein RecX [Kineosporiaceae bacterium]
MGGDPAAAREIAVRRLSAAPRTRAQLARAMADREVDGATAAAVLDDLEAAGAVDDRAYARAWVDGRHRGRGLSRSRLRRELADRGIDSDVADEALAGIDDDAERATAVDLAGRWVARHGMAGDRDRARLFGHLARRGYPPGVVSAVVREMSSTQGDTGGAPVTDDL